MHRACLALGSNIGDRMNVLNAAVDSLIQARGVHVLRISSYYETPPIGGPCGQGAFLNAAAVIETTLEPHELLIALQAIEHEAGRVRGIRWDARTLDLDLLLYDDLILDDAVLTIPHPRMHVRRFVLGPLSEIAPEVVEPTTGQSIASLLANLDRRPNFLCLLHLPLAVVSRVTQELGAFGNLEGSEADSLELAADEISPSDYTELVQRKVADYDIQKWSVELWGDRWMVSDFFPGLMGWTPPRNLQAHARTSWRERIAEQLVQCVRPTIIATNPNTYMQLTRWPNLHPDKDIQRLEIPVICPGYIDPLARLRANADTEKTPDPPAAESLDRITHEILAACAAVRPESLGAPVAPPRNLT